MGVRPYKKRTQKYMKRINIDDVRKLLVECELVLANEDDLRDRISKMVDHIENEFVVIYYP